MGAALHGFTLLEVMVAVAILALSLTAVFSSQIQSVTMSNHAKWITKANMLARCKMSEVELEFAKDGFPESDESESGRECCEIYESDNFTCDWQITRTELPSMIDVESAMSEAMTKDSLSGFIGDFQAERIDKQLSSIGGMGVLSALIPMINDLLTGTIRRVDVTVKWKERSKDKELTVTQFVSNPGEGSMGPLLQMGILQDIIQGIQPQSPLSFDQLDNVLRPDGGGGTGVPDPTGGYKTP
ncbi:MAG: prepilin-type N-terminal cleavage/methylation domain-containing protein [Pseudomonadota bacterium]